MIKVAVLIGPPLEDRMGAFDVELQQVPEHREATAGPGRSFMLRSRVESAPPIKSVTSLIVPPHADCREPTDWTAIPTDTQGANLAAAARGGAVSCASGEGPTAAGRFETIRASCSTSACDLHAHRPKRGSGDRLGHPRAI